MALDERCRALASALACPTCGSDVAESDGAAFVCVGCVTRYPVVRGIPRFVDPARYDVDSERNTSESFAYEFTNLDPAEMTPRKQREDLITFFRATGLDPRLYRYVKNAAKRLDLAPEDIGYEPASVGLRGRRVLDAGCGGGRFSLLVARNGAEVVSLDRSDAVERARAVCLGLPVLTVQGDVLRPPLRAASFDIVFSIGVLHHTADTRAGIHALARLVRPGGLLAVWVYPPEYWGGPIRGAITRTLRKIFLRLPVRGRAAVCRLVFLPIGRVQVRLARRRFTKLLLAPLFLLNIPRHEDRDIMLVSIFDYWSAPVIRVHRSEEIYDWFAEAGLEQIEILPTPTAVTGRRAAAAQEE